MNELTIQIDGYRLFSGDRMLNIRLQPGYLAIVGPGKAAALKWIFELRSAFRSAADSAREGTGIDFPWPHPVRGSSDVFGRNGHRIDVVIRDHSGGQIGTITVDRIDDRNAAARVHAVGPNLRNLESALGLLGTSRFYGGFRSALNVNADIPYFDLNQTGSFRVHPNISKLQEACSIAGELFDVEVSLIAGSNEALGITVRDRTFSWPEFSSGLTQFCALFYDVLMNRPAWILIEQPELHLDESRRLVFLRLLRGMATQGVVFATHDERIISDSSSTILDLSAPS